MGFFDRFRRPVRTCEDPVFGTLAYARTSWEGTVAFAPTKQAVMLSLVTNGSEPTEAHRALFAELVRRYVSLAPAIGAALFRVWEPYLAEWGADAPPIVTSVDAMLPHSTMGSIELSLPSFVVLGYGFTEDVGWDDAMFSVELSDWKVVGTLLDD